MDSKNATGFWGGRTKEMNEKDNTQQQKHQQQQQQQKNLTKKMNIMSSDNLIVLNCLLCYIFGVTFNEFTLNTLSVNVLCVTKAKMIHRINMSIN